jgi:hypothetical protein
MIVALSAMLPLAAHANRIAPAKVQPVNADSTSFEAMSPEAAADAAAQLEKERIAEADAAAAAPAPEAQEIRKSAPAAPNGTAVQVTATAGTTGPTSYPTLNAAFTAINAGTHQGAITVDITADTTETASAILNNSGAGSASYTSVLVRPSGGARVVTGSIIGAIIKLNGADNVTIDGRIGGTGRNLTVSNTSTAAATAAIWLASVAAGNGASNNVVRNLELSAGVATNTSALSTFGIIMNGATISTTADGPGNDNNSFLQNRITKVRYGIVTRGAPATNVLNTVVADNIVGPTAFGADQIGKVGIFMQADTGATVTRNTVQFVGGTFAGTTLGGDRCGICVGSESWSVTSADTLVSGDYTVTRNVVHDVAEERTFSALGIRIGTNRAGGATNNLVANNFIYNVRSNGTSGDQTAGIGVSSGVNDRIVFNSISITGDVDPTGSVAAATYGNAMRISAPNGANNANLTMANNSILMDVNSNTATVRFYAITAPSAAYSFGSGFLNNNNYFINQANPQMRTGGLGVNTTGATTTEFQTIENFRMAFTTPQDSNSKQADPLYISNTSDLHISPTSPNVDMGVAIPGVSRDIDNQNRVGIPDIGADEPNGTIPPANDIAAVAILTPAPGAVLSTTQPITPRASFQNQGTATQTNVTVQFSITGPTGYSYMDTEVIPSIAPEQTIVVTFSPAAPAPAQAGTYTTTASVITPDANAANDQVTSSFSSVNPLVGGSYNVPGDFPSLTNPGGIFQALNTAGSTGNITINITADLTGETGSFGLNGLPGGFTVLIKPTGSARSITGSVSGALIRFIGASGVTVDGSLNGTNDRSLTIENTSTTSPTVILFGSVGTTPITNDVLKNCVIRNGATTASAIVISDSTTLGTQGYFSNITIQNNSVQKAFIGVFATGGTAPQTGSNLRYVDNDLTTTGANAIRFIGLYMQGVNGAVVSGNDVGNFSGAENENDRGIWFATGTINARADANAVFSLKYTGTGGFGAYGITVSTGQTNANILVTNNMIYDLAGDGFAYTGANFTDNPFGILAFSTQTGVNILFNSIHLFGNTLNQTNALSAGIFLATGTTADVRNNIVVNRLGLLGAIGYGSVGIFLQTAATQLIAADYNDYFVNPSGTGVKAVGQIATVASPTIEDWRTATGKEMNSISADPLFVSNTNLHLGCGSPARDIGFPIAAITNDFDGQTRSATTPDIGADEVNAPVALSVGSRKTHGTAGDFDVPLPGIEPRSGGANGDYTIVFRFAGPVTAGAASITTGTGTVVSTTGGATNTITVNLTGVTDVQCLTVTLLCVEDGLGNSGSVTASMRVLVGDSTNNGAVTTSDIGDVKSNSGQIVTMANFRSDVVPNGNINTSDIGLVKSKAGNSVTACP